MHTPQHLHVYTVFLKVKSRISAFHGKKYFSNKFAKHQKITSTHFQLNISCSKMCKLVFKVSPILRIGECDHPFLEGNTSTQYFEFDNILSFHLSPNLFIPEKVTYSPLSFTEPLKRSFFLSPQGYFVCQSFSLELL